MTYLALASIFSLILLLGAVQKPSEPFVPGIFTWIFLGLAVSVLFQLG